MVTAERATPTQFLTFMLADEVFGIDILRVREIIDVGTVTKVPLMPEAIRGVINLRGAVVPVMDLRARFDRGHAAMTKRTCIVVVDGSESGDRPVMGVLVDAVNAVVDIPAADIAPPPAFGGGIRPEFIHGMGRMDGKFVILLDVEHTLAAEDLAPALAAPAA